jgi:hypothetical protein
LYLDSFEYFLYDGSNVEKIILEDDDYFSHINDNYFVRTTAEEISSIIDVNAMQEFELPDSINTKRLLKIFYIKDDLVLAVGKLIHPKQKTTLYKSNVNFNDFEKILETNSTFYYGNFEYVPFVDKGLFYFDNKLMLVNDNLVFENFASIIGDRNKSNIIKNEDHYYFIAIDPIFGRQVFRLPFDFDGFLDATIEQTVVQNLEVYPNPTQDKLTIKSDLIPSNFKYQIYNALGSLMSKGTSNNKELDTSQLQSGNYILIVQGSGGHFYVSKFVKIGRG